MATIRIMLAAALLSCGLAGKTEAYSYNSIAGRWCGEELTYTFTKAQLTVEFSDRTPTRYFKIVHYRYTSNGVTIDWINAKGVEVHTDFEEFASNGRSMAQKRNDVGPRRPFHRC